MIVENLRGRTIEGRFILGDSIGDGPGTVVYGGTDIHSKGAGKDIALKAFEPNRHELSDIQGEAITLSRLRHDHIVPYRWHGVGEVTNSLRERIVGHTSLPEVSQFAYIAMLRANQGSLALAVAQDGPLSVGQVVRYTGQAADALQYAHEEGVVHRDIKPSNLLVHNNELLVADWGGGIPAHSGESTFTRQIPLATTAYAAPENYEGQATVQSDIYSLGTVVWELTAGQHPFPSDFAATYMKKHLFDEVPTMQSVMGTSFTDEAGNAS